MPIKFKSTLIGALLILSVSSSTAFSAPAKSYSYTYDLNGKLTLIQTGEGEKIRFIYDANGNLLKKKKLLKPIGSLENIKYGTEFIDRGNVVEIKTVLTGSGYFLEEDEIVDVEVSLIKNQDGSETSLLLGKATHNIPRSDIFNKFPQYNKTNSGFNFNFDLRLLNGDYSILISVTNVYGEITQFSHPFKVEIPIIPKPEVPNPDKPVIPIDPPKI
ncbi:RHS repeat protein [Paenibacillus ihbetae]|uniref:Uncharacterized protein n=1 Tax=Paenibacillus ihbetae TaxID=1870820 RepID=A0ABX3K2L2_9BACL|nr:RHS repeat protein [Paenibacillus ihbetae]OOC63670.1 hypothetical protein BBD40_18540 [Paenibacillus ihbetae]